MSITAKELAKKLGLSQTAVSMALNNKSGVSTETRRIVVEAAEKYGYDFTRLSLKKIKLAASTLSAIAPTMRFYHTHPFLIPWLRGWNRSFKRNIIS